MRRGLVLSLAAVIPLSVSAQDYAANSRRVDSLFARYGPNTPGVSVRVVEKGRVLHRGEYGMADLEHGVPITPATIFAIGSNAKQFTGLAIAMLVEDGTIDLDADVRTYVPAVPDFGATITVRHLLHHTSGLRDWTRPLRFAGWSTQAPITFDLVMGFLKRQTALNFAPGEHHLYSNTGYVLLAEVISRATGTPFAEWMMEHVFQPLGMTNTRVRARYYDLVEGYARSYQPVRGNYARLYNGLAAYGSCCILSTTDDMVRWLGNFQTAAVGGRAAIRRMVEDTVGATEWDGRLVGYGYGVRHFAWRGHRGLFHSGQWVGFRSATLQVPERELAIVVLGNAGSNTNLREWDILEIYAGTRETVAADPEPGPSLEAQAVPVDAAVLDRYVGTYDFSTWYGETDALIVTREGDRLSIRFVTDPDAAPLTAISPTEFKYRANGPVISFDAGAYGPATSVGFRGLTGTRTEAFDPTVEALEEFTGTYHSEELDTTWRIEIVEGSLVASQLRWAGGTVVRFTPVVRDVFRGSTLVIRAQFIRNAEGDVSGMLVTGRRALNLRFVKLPA